MTAALGDAAVMGCGEVGAEDRASSQISHASFLANFLELLSNQRVHIAQRGHMSLVPVWCLGLMYPERNEDWLRPIRKSVVLGVTVRKSFTPLQGFPSALGLFLSSPLPPTNQLTSHRTLVALKSLAQRVTLSRESNVVDQELMSLGPC